MSAPFDLTTADDETASLWLDAYDHGYRAGLEEGHRQGWAAADEHASRLHREHAWQVRASAHLPSRDVDGDRRRAEASRTWWAAKRGEA